MGWGDYAAAARMRDTITGIAEDVVRRMRPDHIVAQVYDYNFDSLTADVMPPGHDETQLIRTRFSPDKVPSSSIVSPFGPPDVVRVAGKPGNYFILDYVRGDPRQMRYEYSVVPIGGWVGFGGTNLPPGFLWCRGDLVPIDTYSRLFAEIGHNFNRVADVMVDPGGGLFRLPDFRYRSIMGADPVGTNNRWALGASDEDATSLRLERADHVHDHIIPGQPTGGTTWNTPNTGTNRVPSQGLFEGHNHGGRTGENPAIDRGTAHAWQMSNFIIRY